MERRAWVGLMVLAAIGVGTGAGCQTEKRKNNPYMSELGKEGTLVDTPVEVQEFVKAAYPDAEIENVYEMRHRKEYQVRHFEIHMILPGGRKKTIDYNVFQKPSTGVRTLEVQELQGAGTSPGAQIRGETEGQH